MDHVAPQNRTPRSPVRRLHSQTVPRKEFSAKSLVNFALLDSALRKAKGSVEVRVKDGDLSPLLKESAFLTYAEKYLAAVRKPAHQHHELLTGNLVNDITVLERVLQDNQDTFSFKRNMYVFKDFLTQINDESGSSSLIMDFSHGHANRRRNAND